MARANPTTHQYDPLRVPRDWGPEERKLILQLTDTFDDIYRRYGRLRMEDLAPNVRKVFKDTAGNLLEIQADVDQVKLTLTTVEGNVSSLTLSAQEFATRLSNAEGDISTIEQTAQELQTEVTNAKGDISGLQQTAAGLQTQVNNLGNRNRTYLPGTVPSVSERVEGDLLIDTANGNILKRWNGSSWVAVQDGAISIAQQQADKIQWLVASGTSAANMTLTNKLYSLMAENIDLSANDSIKLAVTSQSANLFPSDPSNWEQGTINEVNGSPVASTTRIRSAGYITLNAGTLYTVSRVKSLTGQIYLTYYNNSNTYIGWNGNWVTTYPYSFSLPSGATKVRVVVRRADNSTIVPTDVPDVLFSIVPAGVSGGVKTSKIEIGSDFIDIDSGGTLTLNAANDIKIGSGGDTLANTIDLSANNSIKLAVSGGTNLAKNTKNTETLIVATTSSEVSNVVDATVPLTAGVQYTVSGFLRAQSNCVSMEVLVYYSSNPAAGMHAYSFPYSIPGIWFAKTFTPALTGNYTLRVDHNGSTGGSSGLWYHSLQIEKGTHATDWSPAPSDPASGVKTSKVTIDGTGIAMTTGGTFTVGSQNFNIDAAGNVVMKGTVEAAAGKIGNLKLENGILKDIATNGAKMQINPTTGSLILNDLEIMQESDRINFLSRFVSKLRYFDFSNPNGGFVFRSSSPADPSWMTRFDVEMPTAAKPDGRTYNYGDSYIDGNCSAQSFTDRTPAYFGDALDELRWASGSKDKGIDHGSLPKFAQKTIIGTRINEDGEKEDFQEEGRDLGAMVSVLTRAVQQLADKVDSQQRLIEDLNRRVSA